MLKRFASYYKPQRRLFILDMTASFFVALIGIVYPIVTRRMLNDLIPNKEYRQIVIYGLLLLGLYLIRMGLQFFVQWQGHMMGIGMQAAMREELFAHLEKLPYSFFDNHDTGKIMSRITNDLMDISELAHHGPENLLISSISVITAVIYLCTINWKLTILIFVCVPIMLVIALTLRTRMRDAFKRCRQSMAIINGAAESSISGIRVTKAFNNSSKEEEKFKKGNKTLIEARNDAYKNMGIFHSSTEFITNIFNVIILIAGGFFLYNGEINFGDYSAFVLSVNLFLSPINTLINFMEQYQDGVSGFERFCEIMDSEPEVDLHDAKEVGILEGHIVFDNVSCSYEDIDNKEKRVLKGIDLDIKKGQTYALVGPSGGGKTTICHLIPHFYDISDGEISIDGLDIRKMTLKSLRENIGIVQQDIYLFNASIKENILYGRLDASDDEVMEAAKRANIHDYILTLPDGYDTIIGERGIKLSGGQKQRLSIARVFLKNPSILILDEATSALDNTTEILIQKSLDELCKGRTTIVVAHRLSTIKKADEIAVIDDGNIKERGTHEELMDLGGIYANLYQLQFRGQ